MLTAILAARDILGEDHDFYEVNTVRSCHEDFAVEDRDDAAWAAVRAAHSMTAGGVGAE